MAKEIPLPSGQNAIVDDDCYEWFSKRRWYLNSGGYVVCYRTAKTGVRKAILMHRAVIFVPNGMFVDHINGNKLDNRRENLRTCTLKQNQCNRRKNTGKTSSRFKGVSPTRSGKWTASVKADGENHYLGTFETEEAAAVAYNVSASKLFGAFACLNNV